MQGLSESFFANKSFTFIAAALAFLAAVVLISVIFRLVFGRKLRLPRNGKARLPRLGTVDAFDLDRQRQLVIIRRDNVEHLLMIGGPNDLVIESQIIRAESREPRDFRDARIRDKELREKEPRDSVSWPSPVEAPSLNSPQRKTPYPPAAVLAPEAGVMDTIPIEESIPEFMSATVVPVPRSPAVPLPPRRALSNAVPSGQRLPNPRESFYGRADPSQRPEPAAGPAKELRRATVATPFSRSSTQRQMEATAVKLAPSNALETLPAFPNAPSSHSGFEEIPGLPEGKWVAETGRPSPSTPTIVPEVPINAAEDQIQDVSAAGPEQASIDALEAEMAKLLGRGPG
jgi:hypothetical protein